MTPLSAMETLPVPSRETTALTPRQYQILDAFAKGYHTDEVAAELGLSGETIRTHVKRILAKLDCRTRAQACAKFGAGEVEREGGADA